MQGAAAPDLSEFCCEGARAAGPLVPFGRMVKNFNNGQVFTPRRTPTHHNVSRQYRIFAPEGFMDKRELSSRSIRSQKRTLAP